MSARILPHANARRFVLMSAALQAASRGDAASRLTQFLPADNCTEENIRAELATELREEAAHFVAAFSKEVESLRGKLAKRGISADASFTRIQSHVGDLVSHLEAIVRSQQAPPVAEVGLKRSIESLCQQVHDQWMVELAYESEADDRVVDADSALAVFRVAQDALSHAARYRKPNFISVRLAQEGRELCLHIEDMGEVQARHGQPELAAELNFLNRMQERASRCGGEVEVTRGQDSTLLSLRLPLRELRGQRAAAQLPITA